jgi:hypothetical protein
VTGRERGFCDDSLDKATLPTGRGTDPNPKNYFAAMIVFVALYRLYEWRMK